MKYALILDDSDMEHVEEFGELSPGRVDGAIPIPDTFADVEPASPLPWYVGGSPYALKNSDDSVIIYLQDAPQACEQDAHYIVIACNERPALLAALAAERARAEAAEGALTDEVQVALRDLREMTTAGIDAPSYATVVRERDHLKARVAELEAAVASFRKTDEWGQMLAEAHTEADQLRAEVERLRMVDESVISGVTNAHREIKSKLRALVSEWRDEQRKFEGVAHRNYSSRNIVKRCADQLERLLKELEVR